MYIYTYTGTPSRTSPMNAPGQDLYSQKQSKFQAAVEKSDRYICVYVFVLMHIS
jgi:hypothetical protein